MKFLSAAVVGAGLAAGMSCVAGPACAAGVAVTTYNVSGCQYGVMYSLDYLTTHYPWCVAPASYSYTTYYPAAAYAPAYTIYPYAQYAVGLYASYPPAAYAYSYYPYVYAGTSVVTGTYGASAWGPYGGRAATTGAITNKAGGATRASSAYNPRTGNMATGRTATAYNASTGTHAIGQRGGAANAYTGNYGYGERGAAYNERTGVAAAGSHGTFGNAYTGNQVQAGHGVAYNPNTGQSARVGGIYGENGGVGHVNNDIYVSHDGNVQELSGSKRKRPRAGGSK